MDAEQSQGAARQGRSVACARYSSAAGTARLAALSRAAECLAMDFVQRQLDLTNAVAVRAVARVDADAEGLDEEAEL